MKDKNKKDNDVKKTDKEGNLFRRWNDPAVHLIRLNRPPGSDYSFDVLCL